MLEDDHGNEGAMAQDHDNHDDNDADDNDDAVVARSADLGTAFYLFHHQAGGHKPLLRSARGEVCKPAIALELAFYQALEARYPQLRSFVPPFVGVITVALHDDGGSGRHRHGPAMPTAVTATTRTDDDAITVSDVSSPTCTTPAMNRVTGGGMPTGPLPASTGVASASPPGVGKKRRLRIAAGPPPELPPMTTTMSPSDGDANGSGGGSAGGYNYSYSYSAELWRRERSPASVRASSSREYLVLGDLTRGYARPCVLDIKMGTRQHGADAPPAKVASHTAKCAATTSLALGLRICGMQVYDPVARRAILWDKHWGRGLTVQDIEPALTTYLSNGTGVQWEALVRLRDKVVALAQVVAGTTGVRFWGSSLLLIYEGDDRHQQQYQQHEHEQPGPPRAADVHLIDFAHCQMSETLTTPDEGLLLGLENLAAFFTRILATRSTSNDCGGDVSSGS